MPSRYAEGKRDLGGSAARTGPAVRRAAARSTRSGREFGRSPLCLDLAAFAPQSAALMSAEPGQASPSRQETRDERRAAALRENLRRRKSQARARASQGAGPGEADAASSAKPARDAEP